MLPQAGKCRGGDPAPREERSCFVAFVGFLAANTSTVADFKDQHDIRSAELGGDPYHGFLAVGTIWLQHATHLQARVLGSSVKHVFHSLRSK